MEEGNLSFCPRLDISGTDDSSGFINALVPIGLACGCYEGICISLSLTGRKSLLYIVYRLILLALSAFSHTMTLKFSVIQRGGC
jgi:hypothetical protein